MDRKVTIKQDGIETPLDEIEKEILLNAAMLSYVKKDGYAKTLMAAPDQSYAMFLDDPYSITFSGMSHEGSLQVQKATDTLFG